MAFGRSPGLSGIGRPAPDTTGGIDMNEAHAHTLKVPDATLHYEVCGSGPVLLCIRAGPRTAAASHLSGIFSPTGTRW
jgi:hypothetical protein